jgi:hypothetical protein
VQVHQVHVSLIAQLEALGGLEEWAVYVAAHLPDAPWPGGRDSLIRLLLGRHAPAWAASQAKRAFLLQRLGLPAEWLAHALAVWASYCRNQPGMRCACCPSMCWAPSECA